MISRDALRHAGDDAEGRSRRGVYLAPELWDWLETTAARDGTSRSDLLEGLVMLAMDAEQARDREAQRG